MSDTTPRLNPPFVHPPLLDGGEQYSQPWRDHYQAIADQLATTATTLAGNATELADHATELADHAAQLAAHTAELADHATQIADLEASAGVGVTDGSDAPAGHVGEYLTSSGSGGLTSAAQTDRATVTLPAGDWDVAGSAVITPTIANMTVAQAWLSTATNTQTDPGRALIQSGGAGTLGAVSLVVGPVRFSLTGSTAVHLGCQANFPGGTTVTASAFVRARRTR